MKKQLFLALASAALLYTPVANGASPDLRDVVKDTNRHIIVNTFDNCVRTRWQSGADECFATAAPKTSDHQYLSVYFAFDSAELTPAAQAKLDTVAGMLAGSKAVENININGYADQIGTNSYNYKLSQRRAQVVKKYLASKGYVKTKAVKIKALGESAPVSNCGNLARPEKIACLWRDRRVEIELNVTK